MEPQYIVFALFFFALGSCIGSFLNVVIWRMPYKLMGREVTYQGKTAKLTLSWPPSHCPNCDAPIPWYLNIPMLGWLLIAGRCAKCRAPIAIRYPLVELATGALFLATFLAYFVGHVRGDAISFTHDWPAFLVHLVFLASLLAAAAIDADSYMIPLSIPVLLSAVAILSAPFIDSALIPRLDVTRLWHLANPTIGATVGLAVANFLLLTKVLPLSFSDFQADPPAPNSEAERVRPLPVVTRKTPLVLITLGTLTIAALAWVTLGNKPGAAALITVGGGIILFLCGVLSRDGDSHDATDEVMAEISAPGARKEILKEILFLLFPIAGAIIGACIPIAPPAQPWLVRLLGVLMGFLVGGGTIWMVRILGTLWKGIEAMGLGDVHLMAAAGSVLGAGLVLIAFPIFAPVLALSWALVKYLTRRHTILPFGPWLAMASIVALFVGKPVLDWYLIHAGILPPPPVP